MNALHKFAGIQEISDDANTEPPAPVTYPAPPPIPRDSTDAADENQSQHRSSLPLNRRPSNKSFHSQRSRRSTTSRRGSQPLDSSQLPSDYPPTPRRTHQAGDHALPTQSPLTADNASDASSTSSTIPWGPSHPCFPHPNPHCPPASAEHTATRVIRIKRDYLASGDLYPQFVNLYPEILDPLVSDAEFRLLITNLNARLRRAFSPFTTNAWVDSVVGAFTGYMSEDLGWTGAKRGEKDVKGFLEGWNDERRRMGREVKVVLPRITGYTSLDFVVPDPGIGEGEGGEGEGGGEDEIGVQD